MTDGTALTADTDKDDTGLYGNDTVGAAIAYEFALPAGKYTLTSFHKEWWPSSTPSRPMELSVTGENGTQLVTGQVSVGTNTVTNSWSGQFTIGVIFHLNRLERCCKIIRRHSVRPCYSFYFRNPQLQSRGIQIRSRTIQKMKVPKPNCRKI